MTNSFVKFTTPKNTIKTQTLHSMEVEKSINTNQVFQPSLVSSNIETVVPKDLDLNQSKERNENEFNAFPIKLSLKEEDIKEKKEELPFDVKRKQAPEVVKEPLRDQTKKENHKLNTIVASIHIVNKKMNEKSKTKIHTNSLSLEEIKEDAVALLNDIKTKSIGKSIVDNTSNSTNKNRELIKDKENIKISGQSIHDTSKTIHKKEKESTQSMELDHKISKKLHPKSLTINKEITSINKKETEELKKNIEKTNEIKKNKKETKITLKSKLKNVQGKCKEKKINNTHESNKQEAINSKKVKKSKKCNKMTLKIIDKIDKTENNSIKKESKIKIPMKVKASKVKCASVKIGQIKEDVKMVIENNSESTLSSNVLPIEKRNKGNSDIVNKEIPQKSINKRKRETKQEEKSSNTTNEEFVKSKKIKKSKATGKEGKKINLIETNKIGKNSFKLDIDIPDLFETGIFTILKDIESQSKDDNDIKTKCINEKNIKRKNKSKKDTKKDDTKKDDIKKDDIKKDDIKKDDIKKDDIKKDDIKKDDIKKDDIKKDDIKKDDIKKDDTKKDDTKKDDTKKDDTKKEPESKNNIEIKYIPLKKSRATKISKNSGKPYDPECECDICHKIFSRKYDLIRHRRLHTGDTPYKCKICGQGFTRSDHRDRHIRRTACGETKYYQEIMKQAEIEKAKKLEKRRRREEKRRRREEQIKRRKEGN